MANKTNYNMTQRINRGVATAEESISWNDVSTEVGDFGEEKQKEVDPQDRFPARAVKREQGAPRGRGGRRDRNVSTRPPNPRKSSKNPSPTAQPPNTMTMDMSAYVAQQVQIALMAEKMRTMEIAINQRPVQLPQRSAPQAVRPVAKPKTLCKYFNGLPGSCDDQKCAYHENKCTFVHAQGDRRICHPGAGQFCGGTACKFWHLPQN